MFPWLILSALLATFQRKESSVFSKSKILSKIGLVSIKIKKKYKKYNKNAIKRKRKKKKEHFSFLKSQIGKFC